MVKCWKQERRWPVGGQQFTQDTDKFVIDDDDMDSDTATESNPFAKVTVTLAQWLLECERYWTILQKMQCKTSTNILSYGECLCLRHWKHLFPLEKITQKIFIPSKIQGTISQWNRCLTYLKSWQSDNQMRLLECHQSTGKILDGNSYLWSLMKKSSVSRTQRFLCFQILCCALERCTRTHIQILFGKESWVGSKIHHSNRTLDNWRRASSKVQEFMSTMSDQPEEFQGRIIFMSMSNDIIWRSEDNERECIANATLVSIFAKRFPPGRWSFLGPGSEKKWYPTCDSRHRGEWDRVAELMMIKFRESGHPVFRASSPLSRETLKSKGGGKLSRHFCADVIRLKLFFAHTFQLISAVSTEQSQICVMNTVLAKQERREPWSSQISEEQLLIKPTKNPKPNKNDSHDQERRDPCHSEILEWLQEFRERTLWMTEFLNTETHMQVLLMDHL